MSKKSKFCENFGYSLSIDDNFCEKCGKIANNTNIQFEDKIVEKQPNFIEKQLDIVGDNSQTEKTPYEEKSFEKEFLIVDNQNYQVKKI